ncbi:MAG: ion transporter [Bacteroidales bacterium]|nr:ion transporter [Bacteroidales bacterium]MDT8372971.1 ion transporter [Bacteroidales bacterium]
MKVNKKKLYEIIFEADTREGKAFDVLIIVLIFVSIFLVLLDSVTSVREKYAVILHTSEWIITAIFVTEYLLRIYVLNKPFRYIFSFFGIIDLLAILPSFLGLILVGGQSLMVIRAVRLLRVFRIFKLSRYTSAGRTLAVALYRSREKIFMFISVILTLVVIFGTVMYLIEGEQNGFTSIPVSIYWAIVTMTTVGYGDISPVTGMGQFLASIVMIMGYAIIAVPTGIITSEMIRHPAHSNTQVCPNCMYDRHDDDAQYCKRCGTHLDVSSSTGGES